MKAVMLGVVWLVAVAWGFSRLLVFESTPGAVESEPARWPAESRIAWTAGRSNLVLFAHPRCSCTRATLEELSWILAHSPGRFAVTVAFHFPEGMSGGSDETGLWKDASALPGVHTFRDAGSAEARRFGALTSGHTLLYDAEGRLRFAGGITGARGHVGANAGRETVVASAVGGMFGTARTPVFGCSIFSPEEKSGP